MAHSNKTLITIDNIDWTSKDATAKAFSHFRHLKLGYKLTLIAVIDEVASVWTYIETKSVLRH